MSETDDWEIGSDDENDVHNGRDDGIDELDDGVDRPTGTGTTAAEREKAEGKPPDVPEWDDEYLETVSGRLLFNYDLKKEHAIGGERFDLYGHMELHSEKHFFHPALSFAHHESHEYLFVRRTDRPSEREIDRLVEFGHELADELIAPDEEHYSTDFTFVLVVPEIPDTIQSRVENLDERTLLKYGYYGHYDINVVVVAPDREELVASDGADVEEAFRIWDPIERDDPGLLGLIARRLEF
ncbi:Uncharacterized protein AArcCO_2866 [Halalkaliarchaeum sp. AArc-CO]|uniref:hypothetical protein n=1 Tax=unclassified Halalkaliarchaeum TaxID=2678344 RepID=UPI00217E0359|nr:MULTISPECIES: hypothetical protein [unclassified Halalkaliarchaeum]MDR5674579.1 hypothetical protein [Halalkaliarchaeum sp. AArc-GB]UWG52142.1 Uncharacterized protein AArcCO_2866 [Halalkaliarchaeum sp. AArc-CO]